MPNNYCAMRKEIDSPSRGWWMPMRSIMMCAMMIRDETVFGNLSIRSPNCFVEPVIELKVDPPSKFLSKPLNLTIRADYRRLDKKHNQKKQKTKIGKCVDGDTMILTKGC
jgi:hypothetical protein